MHSIRGTHYHGLGDGENQRIERIVLLVRALEIVWVALSGSYLGRLES